MAKKLYVGNLSFDATEDQLRQAFGQYGTINSAMIVMDRDSGRSRKPSPHCGADQNLQWNRRGGGGHSEVPPDFDLDVGPGRGVLRPADRPDDQPQCVRDDCCSCGEERYAGDLCCGLGLRFARALN